MPQGDTPYLTRTYPFGSRDQDEKRSMVYTFVENGQSRSIPEISINGNAVLRPSIQQCLDLGTEVNIGRPQQRIGRMSLAESLNRAVEGLGGPTRLELTTSDERGVK